LNDEYLPLGIEGSALRSVEGSGIPESRAGRGRGTLAIISGG